MSDLLMHHSFCLNLKFTNIFSSDEINNWTVMRFEMVVQFKKVPNVTKLSMSPLLRSAVLLKNIYIFFYVLSSPSEFWIFWKKTHNWTIKFLNISIHSNLTYLFMKPSQLKTYIISNRNSYGDTFFVGEGYKVSLRTNETQRSW